MQPTIVSIYKIFSITAAAKILGRSRTSVYEYIERGLLRPIKIKGHMRLTGGELARFCAPPVVDWKTRAAGDAGERQDD